MALQPGEILDGKYRIVRLVGEGGMGAVYEGENTRIKRKVAIKVLHGSVAEKQDVVQRFEREAQAAGRIGSEHIVEVLDLGNLPSGERYMVMEFLEGEDLTGRIKRLKRIPPEQCVPLLDQVLEGLGAAHEAQIIHRDLKPDNIWILTKQGGRTDFVKILDFGVSKFSALDDQMSMTRTGAVMGTPYYMSPEQAKGAKLDARSDLYAIGVVAYQMVTGRVPFNAGSFNELLFKIVLESPEPIEQIVPGIDPNFAAIINRAMSREPIQRFDTARDFQAALRSWASGNPAMMPPPAAATGQYGAQAGYGQQPQDAYGLPQPPANMPLGRSNPGMPFGGTPVPGAIPGTGPYAQQGGALGMSHSPLAVTPEAPKKNGTVVALAIVGVLIVVLGGGGAYMLTRPSASQAATKQDGKSDAKPDKKAAAQDTAKPTKTADAEITPAASASAAPSSAASAAASSTAKVSAAQAAKNAADAATKGTAPTTGKGAPPATSAKTAKSADAAKKDAKKGVASAAPPPPTANKGRVIKTDL